MSGVTTQLLINLLFNNITQPDGRQYTVKEVAEQTGVSLAMISQLRTGSRTNPSLEITKALLHFFDVPLSYMDAETKEEAIEILQNRDANKPPIRFRGIEDVGLSPKAQKQVEALLKYIVAHEKAVAEGRAEPKPPRFDNEGNVIDED